MITVKQVLVNPEVMIKHKDNLKNIQIFLPPWYGVFRQYPYLYREFSDRFDEMDWLDIACALRDDPTLISDLKNHLCNLNGWDIKWLLERCPKLSLCMRYRGDPNKVEAAYYVGYPHELNNLNKEEKREMSKRIMEFLRGEKACSQ